MGAKTRLIAGPFLGEFGWELFCWQGRLRRISKERSYEKTYVYCRPGLESLYEDFAEVNVSPPNVKGKRGQDKTYDVIKANKRIVRYKKFWTRGECERNGFFEQEFIKFGNPIDGAPQIVIHPRARRHRPKNNWPKERYEALVRRYQAIGFRVGVIGTAEESHALDNAEIVDYRGRSIRDVCDLLAGARCIVGTSSGPMHLAALCGCPQVAFTDASNVQRYERHWNPFDVAVRIPQGGWQPAVDEVVESTIALIG
jgi:hypothetical protein